MKIAIDLRPLQSGHRFRGIGKYIANVMPALFEQAKEHEIYCYHYGDKAPELVYPQNVQLVSVGNYDPQALKSKIYRKLYMNQPEIKNGYRPADVFFQPDISFGIRKDTATVVVLYDLIPLVYREQYFSPRLKPAALSPIWKWRAEQVARQFEKLNTRFQRTQHIVSISKASIEDLHKMFPGTSDIPYTVTPLAAQSLPQPSAKQIYKKPYFMYVGGTDSRKNLERLIDMFARAVAKGVKEDLVLIGHDFKQKDFNDTMLLLRHIEKSNIKSRIKIIGYVNDEELSTYYSQATAMVFPSNYEGFGMPVLEAMQASCPVICFNNSSIPEVAGDSALMVESEDQFIKAIIDISHKPKLREKLILSGKQRAGQFSWEKTAALTLSALERAAKP